jgi:uncharacterized membrane protein YbaN (DUF454 family)
MTQTFRTVLGIGLLIMALIGALLPVLQGWVFFIAAVGVLGKDHPIIQWCFRMMRKIPWADKALDKLNIEKKPGDYPPGGPM